MITKAERREAAQNLTKALSHPLRHLIWRIISERTASPVEISRETGEPLQKVSHHMNVLVKLGCAEEVDSTPRRGAIEHFFRATLRPMVSVEDWELLPTEIRQSFLGEIVEMEIADRAASLQAGLVGSDENFVLVRDTHVLDEQGLTEMREAMEALTRDVLPGIEAQSLQRLQGRSEPGIAVASSQGLFKVPWGRLNSDSSS